MSNLTLPAENKIKNICFWEPPSNDNINCSFDELKERMIPDGTIVYLFSVHVHNGKVMIKNNGMPVEAVAVWDKSYYYRTQLQWANITLTDGSIENIIVHLKKRKVDGTTSQFDFYKDEYNIWSTDPNKAYVLFNKAKENAVIEARKQIEQEYKEKLERLNSMF